MLVLHLYHLIFPSPLSTSLLNLPPTSHSIPLLWVSWSSRLSSLCHTANSTLAILHRVLFMSQCYSLNSSRPLLPPPSPQVCSLALCLYSCPTNRFISTIFSRFHIYALIYDVCFSLTSWWEKFSGMVGMKILIGLGWRENGEKKLGANRNIQSVFEVLLQMGSKEVE